MKRLRQLHLYLGCLSAPMLILFAATGAAQLFGIRLGMLTEIHTRGYGSLPLMVLAALMGLSVVVTAILGMVMAFRSSADRRAVWACLAFGLFVPVALVVIGYLKR